MTSVSLLTFKTTWTVALLFFLVGTAGAGEQQFYKKTREEYQVPNVTLLNQDGHKVDLKSYLDSDKPIVLDFIYGTCSTICPVLSISFSHFQKKLGKDVDQVRLVSISIDPDNDTPELMKDHLQRYGAQPGWDILTGKRDNIIQVLKVFDAYVANKMNHYPLILLLAPGEQQWVRLYGLLSASDLTKEYEQLMKH
ncbi:MAG: SCO family protein [Gammaproteobacteria bacterium]|nr:SCO family protein [Gammaproteobacteria bacterium]